MRLIDADVLMEKEYSRLREGEVLHRIPPSHVDAAPIIDPVHTAGGCYCKECIYYKSYEFPESGRIIYQCYNSSSYLEECKPDDFCSRSVPKNVQM